MDSSCVIIGTIDVITIGGVTVAGTLGGGTVTGTLVGSIFVTSLCNIVVYVFSVCMVLNIFANLWMACNWLSLIMKGVCGPEFLIMCISSLEALVACSTTVNTSIMMCFRKFHHICISLPPSIQCVACVALVFLHSWSNVPPWYFMYPPSFTLLSFSCTITFIPGGASGILLKSNYPSSAMYASIVGFPQQGIIVFSVIVACWISRHHRYIGKRVYVLEIPVTK